MADQRTLLQTMAQETGKRHAETAKKQRLIVIFLLGLLLAATGIVTITSTRPSHPTTQTGLLKSH